MRLNISFVDASTESKNHLGFNLIFANRLVFCLVNILVSCVIVNNWISINLAEYKLLIIWIIVMNRKIDQHVMILEVWYSSLPNNHCYKIYFHLALFADICL